MPAAKNTTKNVNIGKGLKGGYLFSAPITETVPTDLESPLGEGYVNLGFVDEEGLNLVDESDVEVKRDMNGDAIATVDQGETHTWAFTLVELKKDALAEQYGHKNVKDEDGVISITGASGGFEDRIYVFEMAMKDGGKGRLVLPNAEHQSTDEISINSQNVVGRKVTVLGKPDEEGNSFYQWYTSTETEAV